MMQLPASGHGLRLPKCIRTRSGSARNCLAAARPANARVPLPHHKRRVAAAATPGGDGSLVAAAGTRGSATIEHAAPVPSAESTRRLRLPEARQQPQKERERQEEDIASRAPSLTLSCSLNRPLVRLNTLHISRV